MNISSVISNFPDYFYSNGTEVETGFDVSSIVYIISILLSFLTNSYVIWLIVTGSGNGLVAELVIVNLSVYEIIQSVVTIVVFLTGRYNYDIPYIVDGFFDGVFNIGRSMFQCLICVERYLAVIHPVTFLKLKPLRYRLVCSAVTWGTICVFGGLNYICLSFYPAAYILFLAMPFIIISIQLFCCLAVLRALKQSGPGERGREREEENHMKKRAFYLILITTVSTIIIYTPYIILVAASSQNVGNFILVGHIWLLLAGLVQPVFFLYRVGKLNCIKCQ